jgi:beta-aspartyl-peptidase (threonine type)
MKGAEHPVGERVTSSWGGTPPAGAGWSLLVHGGSGDLPEAWVERHVHGCRQAALAAAEVLRAGGSALDAVERAVVVLEDDPSFNAGTGACLNEEGLIELDAAIMEGSRLRAGGVCAMPPFANPIAIARAVLEEGRHVLYAAQGAARFAVERGFVRASSEAMTTEHARARWAEHRAKTADRAHAGGGTVGCVARDTRGTVAAATSTGGRIDKRIGRVGDSPVPGAGTYADNEAGACSATGNGEAILRVGLARLVTDLARAGAPPEEAARGAIGAMGARVGGTGGLIVVDRLGRLGLARNTRTMAWAAVIDGAEPLTGS